MKPEDDVSMNHDNSSSPIVQRWVFRYGLAFVAVAAMFGLRVVLTAWKGPGLPTYITFYPAVMVVALLGGFGPGLLATALVGLTTAYWILPPEGFAIASPVERLGLVLFSGMGLFMSAVAELYRRNRVKAAAYDREMALREARREKEFLASVLEHASQPFAMGYPDGRVGLCNRAYEQLTGYSAGELRTLDWTKTLTPPEWREPERQKLEELRQSGQPVRYEKEYVRKDGTRVPIELLVHLVKDAAGKPEYYYSFLTDISERKQAEEKFQRLNRTLWALSKSNQALIRIREEKEFLQEICRIIVEDCGHAMVWIGYAEDDEARQVRPVAHSGFEEGYLETLKLTWADTERGRGPTGTAIRTGQLCECRNMLTDPRFAPWREEAIKRGYASSIALPLLAEGRAIGAVTIYSRVPDSFSDDEKKLLEELAADIAIGIAASRARQARARAAADLQQERDQLELRVSERTAELQEKSRYTRNLIEASLDPLVTISREGKITDVNRATELITGASRGQLIGSNFSDYFTEPGKANAGYQKVIAEGLVRDYPLTIRHADGHTTDVLYNAVVYRNEVGEVQGVFAAARDITEHKRMEEAHLELLHRLKDAEENERGRISRELHDRLGQDLTALKLGLRMLRKQRPFVSPASESVNKLEQLTDNLMQDVHRLAWELRPAALDDFGLETALRRYVTEFAKHNGIQVDFHSQSMEAHRFPEKLESTLYRVAQEALTNVLRHAKARRVSVFLEHRPDHVLLIGRMTARVLT